MVLDQGRPFRFTEGSDPACSNAQLERPRKGAKMIRRPTPTIRDLIITKLTVLNLELVIVVSFD